jgi:hypothetical protein
LENNRTSWISWSCVSVFYLSYSDV